MKKKILIPIALVALAVFLWKACRKPTPTPQPTTQAVEAKSSWKEKFKKILHDIIHAEKDIQKEVIKKTIKDVVKDTILAPDPELEEPAHFTLQPGVGFVYIDKPRLSLDIHFWRHKSFGALAGAAVDLTGRNQPVKGFIAGTYTLPFAGFQKVSIFVGTSERALVKLDIKKAEVAVGIRIKL